METTEKYIMTKEALDKALELIDGYREEIELRKEQKTVLLNDKLKYMDLHYQYLGKDNDWRYCLKRALYLLWSEIKINVTVFWQSMPFKV